MAVSFVGGPSTWAEINQGGAGTFSYGPGTFPSVSDGDRLFFFMTWKDQSVTVTSPTMTGYTPTIVGEFADGAVASGNGTGSMRIKVWYVGKAVGGGLGGLGRLGG